MPTKPPKPKPPGHVLSERFADPDLVDRIFDYVVAMVPELATRQADIKRAVRSEFAGQQAYVRRRSPDEQQALAVQILAMFNGRNTTEISRKLRIGRATVYRVLKQPGGR